MDKINKIAALLMLLLILWFLIYFLFSRDSISLSNSECGDWTAFKDEKCVKVFAHLNLRTYKSAKSICTSQKADHPKLVMIHSKEEQDFIENLLFDEKKVIENVWIGAKFDNETKQFYWDDENQTNFTYENWEQLKDGSKHNCVEIIPNGKDKGKWTNTPCEKRNVVVCQKNQEWTLEKLKKEYLRSKKQSQIKIQNLEDSYLQMETTVRQDYSEIKYQIEQNYANLVPIGFIYTQLPNQAEPLSIWPNYKWQDVTKQYSNLFFRAQGAKTKAFGKVQQQSAPRLTKVNAHYGLWKDWNDNADHILIPGQWTAAMHTGNNDNHAYTSEGTTWHYIKFFVSDDEVRPQNMAVKIWKRIE